jgi:pimeloyl-ACP methyl ester carboxylesterase
MNLGIFSLLMSGGSNPYPEYQGAAVTTSNITYASVNDPTLTALKATLTYVTGATNLPILICGHGYHETVADMNTADNNLTRWARLGYFIIAVEGRGNNGSSGVQDDAGRETMDVYDALQYVITNHSDKVVVDRISLLGFSGGGASALLMATRYPDLFQSATDFFGISDWSAWYTQEPARQAALVSDIGGTPAAKPDEYAARKTIESLATNFQGYLTMFHDADDASVEVSHSQNVAAAYVTAGRTDYYYSESNSGSADRWLHAYPLSSNDLNDAEPIWKNRGKTEPIRTIATSGTLKIIGMVKTKRFTVYMNDGSYLNAGRSRFGTLVYNTVSNSYEVTNDSSLPAVVSIVTVDGLVATGVLAAAEAYTFTPVTIAIDGNTPIIWFDAASKKLLSASDVTTIADKTGGIGFQGYAWTYTANRPALLSTDINSLPAIEFVAASSEGFSGLRRSDIQGLSAFTFVEVSTGTIIDHGVGATVQTQFTTLSGGQNFTAINNGGSTYGQDAQAASYKVRSVIYDGSQSTNATKLIRRDDKVQQSLSFTGTIPTTNESNTSSVFGIGKRSYSANYFDGKIAEFMIYNTALSDVGDKEDILKTKYAI